MDAARDYENDFIGWTESQAAILGNLPKGAFGLDAHNLAEEVADLGRSEIRETSSLLRQVLVHLIKLAVEPRSVPADHWVDEVLAFQGDAVLACTAGIRQRIDMPRIWALAKNAAVRAMERQGVRMDGLPADCPLSLEDLLRTDFDPVVAAGKVAAAMKPAPGAQRS